MPGTCNEQTGQQRKKDKYIDRALYTMSRQSSKLESNGHVDAPMYNMNGLHDRECWEKTKFGDLTLDATNWHNNSSLGTVLCVITGASRGFGRSLAWELCTRVTRGSALLLVARTEQALRVLAEELTLQYPEIGVKWVAADLGTADGVRKTIQAAQELNGWDTAQRILIVNNAGKDAMSRRAANNIKLLKTHCCLRDKYGQNFVF